MGAAAGAIDLDHGGIEPVADCYPARLLTLAVWWQRRQGLRLQRFRNQSRFGLGGLGSRQPEWRITGAAGQIEADQRNKNR